MKGTSNILNGTG